jgi:hypothetical protein
MWCCFCCFRRLLDLLDTLNDGFVQYVETTILWNKADGSKEIVSPLKVAGFDLDRLQAKSPASYQAVSDKGRKGAELVSLWGTKSKIVGVFVGQTPASYDMVSKALVLSEERTGLYSSMSTTCVGQGQMQRTLSLFAILLTRLRCFGRMLGLWLSLNDKLRL